MPGVDFGEVRASVALADVLDLLGFVPSESSGDQVRGPGKCKGDIAILGRSLGCLGRLLAAVALRHAGLPPPGSKAIFQSQEPSGVDGPGTGTERTVPSE